MLLCCPECDLQISDKAIVCPHCGYPLKPSKMKNMIRTTKRKRLPNGFGQITELKNQNLRNPFRVMVPCGKDENGKPVSKLLKPKAYFKTYNDAYAALVEYNKNPYEISEDITFKELYEKWSDKHFKKIAQNTIDGYENAFNYCSIIHDMKISDIRIKHIKYCLNEGYIMIKDQKRHPSVHIQRQMKILMDKMLDYAIEYELIDKNYARAFTVDTSDAPETKKHIIYDEQEFLILWDNLYKIKDVDIILILCYTGFRPSELLEIKIDQVNLAFDYITGGSKTKAGKNRIVPIHSKIRPLISKRYEESLSIGSQFLINENGKPITYSIMRYRNSKLNKMLKLNTDHRLHDGRKHFISMAKNSNVDEYAIKRIVGHAINDITENIYTERDVEWLKQEIEKIKV